MRRVTCQFNSMRYCVRARWAQVICRVVIANGAGGVAFPRSVAHPESANGVRNPQGLASAEVMTYVVGWEKGSGAFFATPR
jgi:hypothetical protein